jgi:hypothetical protein
LGLQKISLLVSPILCSPSKIISLKTLSLLITLCVLCLFSARSLTDASLLQ